MVKRLFAVLLGTLGLLSLAACGGKTPSGGAPGSQIANPFADYDSLAEATAAAGFDLAAPAAIDGYDAPRVQLMSGKMLQLIYRSGDERLIIRKAVGGDDISGDYNSYAETGSARVNGSEVTLKGADGRVSTAIWCAGGCSYALLTDTPMARDVILDLIAEIA